MHCTTATPGRHSTWQTVFRQLHSPAVVLDLDPPTQLPTWSRVQELSSETAAFALLDLLRGTGSQTSPTTSLTQIYLNAVW